VDGVTFQEYEKHLEANLADLVGRLKRKAYRARLVRRKYIPKGPGKFRTASDKVLARVGVARLPSGRRLGEVSSLAQESQS
jgi:hypothetical protein